MEEILGVSIILLILYLVMKTSFIHILAVTIIVIYYIIKIYFAKKKKESVINNIKNDIKVQQVLNNRLNNIEKLSIVSCGLEIQEDSMMDIHERFEYIQNAKISLTEFKEHILNNYILDHSIITRKKENYDPIKYGMGTINNYTKWGRDKLNLSYNFVEKYIQHAENLDVLFNILNEKIHDEIYDNLYTLSLKDKYNDALNKYNEINERFMAFAGITTSGVEGEDAVNRELEQYRDVLVNLKNIRLEVDGESIETDHIVISKNGIFSIETKNYGSSGLYSLRITRDGVWSKILKNGQEEIIQSVTSQVSRHVEYSEKFLNNELKSRGINRAYIFIEPIIVISNDNVDIDNKSDIPILRKSNIYEYIKNFKGKNRIKKKEVKLIQELFEGARLPAKKYSTPDYINDLKIKYFNLCMIEELIFQIHILINEYDKSLEKYGIVQPDNVKKIISPYDIMPLYRKGACSVK